jgi:DNA-binding NarL/FixJ family response regulator
VIRVFIIAPALAVRVGLRFLLETDPSIQVVGESASLPEGEEAQPELDVLIWSPTISMDPEALRLDMNRLRIEQTTALLLMHNDPDMVMDMAKIPVRAWGMLDPESSQEELIASLHALHEGLSVSDTRWLNQLINSQSVNKESGGELVELLTGREIEILQLLAQGLANKQIAARLGISAHTVKFHISSIYGKLGATSRTEAVRLGLQKGLILL